MKRGVHYRFYSYISIFAVAFCCIIGWGSFNLAGTIFLPRAGAVGSLIGILIASIIALAVCVSYINLARAYPKADSSYSLIKSIFGIDHAYFLAWSLLLAYLCILWANCAAMAFLGRYLFGSCPLYGISYEVLGHSVYPGDILISVCLLALSAFLITRGNEFAIKVITVLCGVMILAVVVISVLILSATDLNELLSPAFAGTSSVSHGGQILSVVMMAPYLFVGFEVVSHMNTDGKISLMRLFITAGFAIAVSTAMYLVMTLVINSGFPDGFRSWEDYSYMGGTLSSFDEMPAFYGVYRIMGNTGVFLLSVAVICALSSTVLGFMMISARTIRIMSEDHLSVKAFSKVNKKDSPYVAVIFVMLISALVMFVGMRVIGWAVDITTLAICIVYGYISLGSAMHKDTKISVRICGVFGLVCSIGIFLLMTLPNSIVGENLMKGDYLIFSIWCLTGLVCYRYVLGLDKGERLGHSMMMWLMFFFLFFYSTNMWTHNQMLEDLQGVSDVNEISSILMTDNLIRSLVVIIVLILLFELFTFMLKREKDLGRKVFREEERNRMRATLLSNMSHDIRTPMNAILGFADLALQDTSDTEKMVEYLEKIRVSGSHLLSLINDVLEMTRLENGDMELKAEHVNLPELVTHIKETTAGGATAKQLNIETDIHQLEDENVVCDRSRLSHILLFALSNAIDNTPDGGKVSIGVMQLSHEEKGKGIYEFYIRDNGSWISTEILEKISETSMGSLLEETSAQNMAFGLAVTKKIIEVMGGHIEAEVMQGAGNVVHITMEFDISPKNIKKEDEDRAINLEGKRALIVDDIMINRQIAAAMLAMYGMETEEAKDGVEAVERVVNSLPGHYDVVLMDIQMPEIDGFQAAKAIREMDDPINAAVPIFAMTANVFDEDKEKAFESGMDGFIPKPVDREYLIGVLADHFGDERGKE